MSSQESFNIKLFLSKLSPDIISALNVILDKGFELTLVGGCIRDFAMSEELSDDFDFEIRHFKTKNFAEFQAKYLNLIKSLESEHDVACEALPFSIYRLSFNNIEMEVSVPRTETYKFNNEAKKHSEFEVNLDNKLDHSTSFLRRDFTINSMGVHFTKTCTIENLKFIDPFNGLKDLQARLLKSNNPNFTLDPVRYLRMIRFQLKFDFDFDKSLKISEFNLKQLTFYYIEKEFNKLKSGDYFKRMWLEIDKEKINISDELRSIDFMKTLPFYDELSLKENILESHLSNAITAEQVLLVTSLFSWKKKPIIKYINEKK